MSQTENRQVEQPGGTVTLPPSDARQGSTGMGVRYVLVISIAAAVIILGIIYVFKVF